MGGSFPDDVAQVPAGPVVYFDGQSSRKRAATVALADRLEISEGGIAVAHWAYVDIRRAEGPPGLLRLTSQSAPHLARLEIRDAALASELESRCPQLDAHLVDRRGVMRIFGWSAAAAVSIVLLVLFAIPFAADRLAPLVPDGLERRLGAAAELQVKTVFGDKVCSEAAGQAAYDKLLRELREAAGLEAAVQSYVLSTPVPNAFALPGGKVYLFSALLAKAQNPDEIAGVLAHEFGHLKHRDNMRGMIYNGGTSFLIGLLFGDVTGSSTLIFASRSVVTASYSREAEQRADDFAIEVMHRLGRPAKAMGELLFRVTGKQGDKGLTILASHPLTEDRLKRMSAADIPSLGAPLLTDTEWKALKAVCGATD
ncbi:MAG TPA: M48 family metallopeptidase [Bradyrhizobium sp.]|nr:M48 family metallopeptidase [Bradyrhizobium sp.]